MEDSKYRFWDPFNAVMTYSKELGPFFRSYARTITGGNAPTLMQSTGLVSRHGATVFEGDILDFDEREWGDKFTPEVVPFAEEFFTSEWPMSGTHRDVVEHRAVIGNIYQDADPRPVEVTNDQTND